MKLKVRVQRPGLTTYSRLMKFQSNSSKERNIPDIRNKGMFLCKKSRPDIQTVISFIITRVQEPNENIEVRWLD